MKSKILLSSVYTLEEDPWERRQMKPYPPLGILYISSSLKENGLQNDDIRMFDATFNPGLNAFLKMLETFKPDLVGITTNTITENKTLKFIKTIKDVLDIPIVVGGPGPTMNSKSFLDAGVNCVVLSEGEETAVEVFNHYLGKNEMKISDIAGITYKFNNQTIITHSRPLITHLDSIPFPDRTLLNISEYSEVWKKHHKIFYSSIITARGCPYSCTWCARDLSFGRKYRYRSVDNVIDEIIELKDKYKVDALRFVDDILTVHRKRSMALFSSMIERDVRIPFECLTRVDRVDSELLTVMKKAGLQLIYYGVESGSQRILNAMNKQIRVSDIYKSSKIMKKLKLMQSWFLMLGYPPETVKDIKKTLKILRELNPDKFGISIAYPLPKTKFFQDLVDNNMLLINQNQWDQSLDNKLLFTSEYSNQFYKWAIRGLYLNYYTSRFHTKHKNILSKILDTGAYLCTVKSLEFLSRLSGPKLSNHIDGDELDELPVDPMPIQC
ncbi:MAG: tRNA-2-methylthio-N(6)-dimethylallyladenosine synthase [Candidatus Heimdallarchaeota archaeon LC_3]|nr:MAG: tRNA-2-methylthio-N(6)-dimethylallyladenosine synthase [Candidatus Heimdallarchaeota archaeon LC_3]